MLFFFFFLLLFQIPQNTSILVSDDLTVDLKDDTALPHDSADLLNWVMLQYRAVTTFSAVHGANNINLKIGEGRFYIFLDVSR